MAETQRVTQSASLPEHHIRPLASCWRPYLYPVILSTVETLTMPSTLLYRGTSKNRVFPSSIDIAISGLDTPSANPKTGIMAQLWILVSGMTPKQAQRTGDDAAVCGGSQSQDGCIHRLINSTTGTDNPADATCYVRTYQGPLAVHKVIKDQQPQVLDTRQRAMVAARGIRLGAYGDPAMVPLSLIKKLVSYARLLRPFNHTGYTAQWNNSAIPSQHRKALQAFCMASVASPDQATRAASQGWRYYRIRQRKTDPILPTEILCPNETIGITCSQCLLCDGNRSDRDKRKHVVITNTFTKNK